jgi:hypothetical protein
MDFTRDRFIGLLEKTAEVGKEQEIAVGEHEKNQKDSRSVIHDLFDNAHHTEKTDSKLVNKLLPPGKGIRETSNHLLKIARVVFSEGGAMAEESAAYREVALRAFQDETKKIFE